MSQQIMKENANGSSIINTIKSTQRSTEIHKNNQLKKGSLRHLIVDSRGRSDFGCSSVLTKTSL